MWSSDTEICLACGKKLPRKRRVNRKYCDDTCRWRAWFHRHNDGFVSIQEALDQLNWYWDHDRTKLYSMTPPEFVGALFHKKVGYNDGSFGITG